MSRRRRLLVATPLLAVGLAACGSSLAANDIADGAEEALEAEVGVRPDVSCPEDLDAEVGAEARCTLTVEGDPEEYGVTVTVTSVEGDTANFDVQVDDEPSG
ncbi:DUF4333 domain-containing protein [Blastococcus mobilis]|uniref:DUF4333 domain-containing protein n=1 Tax=Blastococcus mobilis TaxID=1938746 RepID=A0A239AW74_9ACTN|nr:DUF4333 domain-containing protein [Blastococcus mobilis]SNR99601.1 protein of unknown function [Blastococcus mobilis]